MPALLAIESLIAERGYIEQKIAALPNSPWGTERLMWRSRLDDVNEQIKTANLKKSNYASVALIFDGLPVIGSSDIRLDFASDVLANYQSLISLLLASNASNKLSERGPPRESDKSRLYIRDLVKGSMGFLLEELAPSQHEMLPTRLKNAVESSTELLEKMSIANDLEFDKFLTDLQPRIVSAIQRFAKGLNDSGASTKIVGDERILKISIDEVGTLSRRLSDVTIKTEVRPTSGKLLGILPDSGEFEMELPNDEGTIKGDISDDLATKYVADVAFKQRLILRPVRAQLSYHRTLRGERVIKESITLINVESTDDDLPPHFAST